MKLPNITHGPVTLSKVEYYPRLSEETLAFAAVITVEKDGQTLRGDVQNEGMGGPNCIRGTGVYDAVKAYCDTLPPDTSDPQYTLTMCPDLLISIMVGDAADKYEDEKATARIKAKGRKQGYSHLVWISDTKYVFLRAPSSDEQHLRATLLTRYSTDVVAAAKVEVL